MAWLWNGSVFGSAFLLFVAQPLLAKWLLPTFGGSPGTWAGCMVFFQMMLLVGYAYAHGLSRLRSPRLELGVHLGVAALAAGLALCTRTLPELAASTLAPALRIPWLLLQQCGVAYLLLSSTSPLLQRWAGLLAVRAPHRLFAVSNAGSLLALLAYPSVIESALPLPTQYSWWACGCAAFAVASSACALFTLRRAAPRSPGLEARGRAAEGWQWACYAFVPSVFLLAVTNHITVDIAPTPLLWVLPLALYLISFIAAFAGFGSNWHGWLVLLFVVLSIGLGYNAFAQGSASLFWQLGVSLLALFVAAWLCHAALVRSRPAVHELTSFYLWIALGGALGGAFVSLLAPLLFNDYYELELATALTYGVLWWSGSRDGSLRGAALQRRSLLLGLGICLPLLAASVVLRAGSEGRTGRVLERQRSFLGPLRVTQFAVGRVLTHGRIRHGMQLAGAKRAWPTMYFARGTALARVLEQHGAARARRIGVVGLGVGTLAAYARAHDVLRFYELDVHVLEVAQRWFTFLSDTPASVQFALGDGRLLLAHEPNQGFDVLVLDAFSSDAVPAHLLTREAFGIYLRHLAPTGVLLANVSNRHLAVDRVVRASARAHGLACEVVETLADADRYMSKVRWAVMMHDQVALARMLDGFVSAARSGVDVAWTDAQTSVWSIIR